MFPCTNGKSEGEKGVLFKISSMVGARIFSGTTHSFRVEIFKCD